MAGPLTKAGRYEIVAEMGRGSMGVVYQGFDPIIGRTVAIKTMLIEGLPPSEFEEYKQRFQREAQSAGVLTHPNIVTVYDFGEDSGVLFLAMEFLEGKSIQQLVEKHNIMPIETLVPMYEQICGALDHAHQHKIVHRDIKPANIMILDSGLVKVMDFGIAKVMSMGMTQAGQILGTPNYMSPEQVKGRQVDGRSDIFSLGVILYELVTGEKPFGGQNITTVIYKIINEDPIPPRELDATIHPGLSFVISKALAKNPAERYQTCRELAEDLRNYKNLGGMGAPSATVVIRVPPIVAQREDAVQKQPPPQRSSPRVQARTVQPPVEPQITPPSPQPLAPQPQRAPVAAPKFAAVQPAQKSSSSVAWAFIVVLLLAGLGGGGFYYYTNIYLPQHAQNETGVASSTPTTTQPSTQPNTAQGGSQVAQNPSAATAVPGTEVPNSTTPAAGQPGASTAQPANPQPSKPQELPHDTSTPATPSVKNGRVEIASNVKGADITVDGRGTGLVTPHALELSPGEHTITISMDGYNPGKITVSVEGGRTVSKRIALAEETTPTPTIPEPVTPTPAKPAASDDGEGQDMGIITIVTVPPGIDISIDGKPAGKSPASVKLKPGDHTYSYACPFGDPQSSPFQIKSGGLSRVTLHCTQ